MEQPIDKKLRWYQTVWGILLIFSSILVLSVFFALLLLTINFWWQIKQGHGEELHNIFYGDATGTELVDIDQKRAEIEDASDPYLGNSNAELVIVEFVDYQCPYCREFTQTLHRLNSEFGDKIKIIIRDFPFESIHPGTDKIAQFVNCAHKQDKFLSAHDLVFLMQDEIPTDPSDEYFYDLGDDIGISVEELSACLNATETVLEISEDFDVGYRYQVEGTPSFFVNGELVEGAIPFEVWQGFIEDFFQ